MVRRGRIKKAGSKGKGILQQAMGDYKMEIPKADIPSWGEAFSTKKPLIDEFPSMKDEKK